MSLFCSLIFLQKCIFQKKLSFVNPFDTWPWRAQNWNTAFVLGPMSITIPQCVRTRLCLVNYMIRLRMSLIIMCIQVISWYLILSIVCCNFLQCQHHFSTAFAFGTLEPMSITIPQCVKRICPLVNFEFVYFLIRISICLIITYLDLNMILNKIF